MRMFIMDQLTGVLLTEVTDNVGLINVLSKISIRFKPYGTDTLPDDFTDETINSYKFSRKHKKIVKLEEAKYNHWSTSAKELVALYLEIKDRQAQLVTSGYTKEQLAELEAERELRQYNIVKELTW